MKVLTLKISAILLGGVLISGCAGMSGSFGCNATSKDSCMPIEKVNERAQAGKFDRLDSGDGFGSLSNTESFTYPKENESAGYQGLTPSPGEPVRYGETVQRIWIAPYQDISGNYHEPSYVYSVLKPGHWVGAPEKEITLSQTELGD